jgi:hypothetical protein
MNIPRSCGVALVALSLAACATERVAVPAARTPSLVELLAGRGAPGTAYLVYSTDGTSPGNPLIVLDGRFVPPAELHAMAADRIETVVIRVAKVPSPDERCVPTGHRTAC